MDKFLFLFELLASAEAAWLGEKELIYELVDGGAGFLGTRCTRVAFSQNGSGQIVNFLEKI